MPTVPIALLVDPDDESIIRFRPDAPPKALRGTDRIDLDPVLSGFEHTVEEVFATLRPE
jgi:Uma2 family endonuclease